jgi:hypothetical protein
MALFRSDRAASTEATDEVEDQEDEVVIDLTDRSPRSGLLWKDLVLLTRVIDSGVDMGRPLHHQYSVYFDSKKLAEAAGRLGREEGFQVTVGKSGPGSPHRWLVVYERYSVLDLLTVIAADDFFRGLVDELGGKFQGLEIVV